MSPVLEVQLTQQTDVVLDALECDKVTSLDGSSGLVCFGCPGDNSKKEGSKSVCF